MSEQIKDGTGNGYQAKVDSQNRLWTYSKNAAVQHTRSKENQDAFQVIGTTTLSAATSVALHLKNTSQNKILVVTYIRHQTVGATGGTSFPNTSNYFKIALGRTYSSGGATATPVVLYGGSGNTAPVTCYQTNPTLTGTDKEIDRWYTKADGDMNTFNKEGALIIPPNETLELSYVGDQTSGTLYTRLSFYMDEE